MKKIISLLSFLCLTLFIVSCSNADNNIDEFSSVTYKNLTAKGNSETQRVVSTDFAYYAKQIGILHNDYLRNSFNNFNYNSTDYKQEILNSFSNLDEELFNENYNHFINYTSSEEEEEQVLNFITDPVAVETLHKFNDEITKSGNLIEFIENIDNDLRTVENQLRDEDYATLLVTAEVMKKSYEFWAPREIGGTGEGELILNNFIAAKQGPPKGWKRVIYADGLGAAGAFIGNAFFMGAGPVGVGAYFGSVAFCAGFSSAMGSWK